MSSVAVPDSRTQVSIYALSTPRQGYAPGVTHFPFALYDALRPTVISQIQPHGRRSSTVGLRFPTLAFGGDTIFRCSIDVSAGPLEFPQYLFNVWLLGIHVAGYARASKILDINIVIERFRADFVLSGRERNMFSGARSSYHAQASTTKVHTVPRRFMNLANCVIEGFSEGFGVFGPHGPVV